MTIWYGFRSTMTRSGVEYISELKKPNGSNMYVIKDEDIEKLPPSHVPVRLILKYRDVIDIPNIAEELKGKVNEYLVAPGSFVNIVDDFKTEIISYGELYEDNIGGECAYTASYADGSSITSDEYIVQQLQATVDELQTPIKDEPTNPCILYDEAPMITLPIPIKVNLLQSEYIAKNCYIFSSIYNKWLLPYANRIGYRCHNDTKETSVVILPYWDAEDIVNYSSILLDLGEMNLTPQKEWSHGYIKLSDGLWYKLLPKIVSELKEYTLQVSIPKIQWKAQNLQRVTKEISEGLLPFEEKYPDVTYDDGDKRISVVKIDNMYAINLLPDNYMLGLYPDSLDRDRLREEYINLWNSGSFLTNPGHVSYINSYDPIDYNYIKRMDKLKF